MTVTALSARRGSTELDHQPPHTSIPTVPLHRPAAPQDSFSKAFVTALLLTGSAELAESVLLDSIRLSETGDIPGDALLGRVVTIAVRTESELAPRRALTIERASSLLPAGLQPVLCLPPTLRRCFVLRFLLNLPRESCARLLRLDIAQVDEATRMAAEALARIVEEKKAA